MQVYMLHVCVHTHEHTFTCTYVLVSPFSHTVGMHTIKVGPLLPHFKQTGNELQTTSAALCYLGAGGDGLGSWEPVVSLRHAPRAPGSHRS